MHPHFPWGGRRTLAWPPFLLALAAALAAAPTGAEPVATLPQAFEHAWAQQPEAGAAGARRDAAQQGRQAAQRWTVEPPALALNLKSDRFHRNDGAREIEAGVAVPLWLPGERARTQGLADAEWQALDSRAQAQRLRLAGELRQAWWAWQLARLDLAAAQARHESAQRLASDVARRVAAGDLSRADRNQADGAVAAAQAEVGEAGAEAAQARQALAAWGIDMPAATPQPEPAPAAAGAEPDPAHPLLLEMGDRVRLAQRALDLAAVQTRGNPELSFGAKRERDARGERDVHSLTFGVRIPLGAASGHRAKVATASAEQIEAERGLALAQQRLRADVAAARARVQAAQAGAEVAARRAALAQETRGFYDKSFRLGESDLPARLRVEAEAFEAERLHQRARIAVHQAISHWRQALGLLPQ